MMATAPTPEEVSAARRDLRLAGVLMVQAADTAQIARVIKHVGGDVDLAVTAILMDDRPGWLTNLIGNDMRVDA